MAREDIFERVVYALCDNGVPCTSRLDGVFITIHTNHFDGLSRVRNAIKAIGLDVMKVQAANFKSGHYTIVRMPC